MLDVLLAEKYYLLENCYDNKKVMVTYKEFDKMKKEKISASA